MSSTPLHPPPPTYTPKWVDPFSPEGRREATSKILTGTNYRVFYEGITRKKLIKVYQDLCELVKNHEDDEEKWKESVRQMLRGAKGQDKNLKYWLLGLTKKTADNLGIEAEEYPALFSKLIDDIKAYPSNSPVRDTALLLWCGAATLTIRGSQKSKIGKALEKSIARAALSVIGLHEGDGIGEFQLNVGADQEVARETDAEIRTKRGKVRVEIGLIGVGNPEVIGDKIGRIGKNGVIMFDILAPNSSMWKHAENSRVKLIQMRNNHPVEELRQHLAILGVPVQAKEILLENIESQVKNLPLDYFS